MSDNISIPEALNTPEIMDIIENADQIIASEIEEYKAAFNAEHEGDADEQDEDILDQYAVSEPEEEEQQPDPQAKNLDLTGFTNKTVFLRVRFGSIGNTRKVAGAQVLTTDADVSLLRVSKTLLESPELENIRQYDAKLRKWLANTALPYDIGGVLLLPVGLIQTAEVKLQEHQAHRGELIDAFVAAYPNIKAEAQKQLGSLYNEAEYPTVDEVKDRFRFEWQYITFGTPGALEKINPELYKQEQEKAAAQLKEAANEVVAVMRGTLYEMVNHLKERLTPSADGKAKILRESAVTKLQEFLNNFDLRDVTNDKGLQLEVQKLKALMGSTTAVALRTSDEFREKIRAGMENVTESLGKLVEEKPGRKFKDIEA